MAWLCQHMSYDLAESVGSWEHWLWGIARERNDFLLFSNYFENPSTAHNFGTTGLIQVGISAKCTSQNEHLNQIENWNCHRLDCALISLDRITHYSIGCMNVNVTWICIFISFQKSVRESFVFILGKFIAKLSGPWIIMLLKYGYLSVIILILISRSQLMNKYRCRYHN